MTHNGPGPSAITPSPCFPIGARARVRHREPARGLLRAAQATWRSRTGAWLVSASWRPGNGLVVRGWSRPGLSVDAVRWFMTELRERPLALVREPIMRLLWPRRFSRGARRRSV
jgi:hypothetical protein